MNINTHSKTSYFLCLKEEFYTKQIYLLTIQLNRPHALKMFLNYYYLKAIQLFLQTAASPRQNQMIQCKVYDIIFIYLTEIMLIP